MKLSVSKLFLIPILTLSITSAEVSAMRNRNSAQIKAVLTINITNGETAEREEIMEIFGFSHEINSPRDAASGLPTGKRQHKPFTVSKDVDQVSPLILLLLTGKETITEWRLKIFTSSPQGKKRLVRTIELEDAYICGVKSTLSDTELREKEHVSFCYSDIIWRWENGIVTEDNWPTSVE